MLSGLLCRAVTTILGFVWPAYQCFKDVESTKSDYRKWCIYWIVIVLYTSLERLADLFIFWIPLYSELKIGLVYFLACANGTVYMYDRLLMPFLTQHQAFIDDHVAVGRAYVQNHISSNLSWVKDMLRSKMFGLIAAVQQFQTDQQAADGAAGVKAAAPNSQWRIPAVPASTPATGIGSARSESPTESDKRTRRRFGLR
eukprot:jgi/Ulvmu1/12402/UM009_0049.1